jgi:thiol:disulfide interchange protein
MKLASHLKLLFLTLAMLGMLACNASQTLLATPNPLSAPVSSGGPYDEAAVPKKDIDAALANAQKDGKLVLLDFGANWCPDCVVLSKLFEDPSVQPYLQDHFYVVRINVGQWDKNLDISQKYGKPIDNGIPAVVVLASNGDILATTKDGALANARTATPQEILGYLKTWVAKKP